MLQSPCTYQGGKQRLAKQIVDIIELTVDDLYSKNYKFFDLCCGSGAVTLELLNRGFNIKNVTMVDKGSWGKFWSSVGTGTFDVNKFKGYISKIPLERAEIQGYLKRLASMDAKVDEEYVYLMLQAGAFGGKQIWRAGNKWCNATFRSFWQPTETSNRRSVVNPMMPMPDELYRRTEQIVHKCYGVNGLCTDVTDMVQQVTETADNAIVYLDPPYSKTEGYGFMLDYINVIRMLQENNVKYIFVSEKEKLSMIAYQLAFSSAKGGISGMKKHNIEEWLNVYL